MLEAPPRRALGGSQVVGVLVGEHQAVGHVLPPAGAEVLLRKHMLPADRSQEREDEFLLGLGLVGSRQSHQLIEQPPDFLSRERHTGAVEAPPSFLFEDALAEEVTREQSALNHLEVRRPAPQVEAIWRNAKL